MNPDETDAPRGSVSPDLSRVDDLAHHLTTRVNVGDALARAASLFPDRVAVVEGEEEITYRQLLRAADQFGDALSALGVRPGDCVAMVLTNSWRFLATYFACARAGFVATPINVVLACEDIAWILDDCRSEIVIVDDFLRTRIEPALEATPRVRDVITVGGDGTPVAGLATHSWDGIRSGGAAVPLERFVPERGFAQCLYTSGTTSRPKGVLTSHVAVTMSMFSNAIVARMRWGATPDVTILTLPLFHTTALNASALPTLLMGGTLVMPGIMFDAAKVLDAIERWGGTHVMLLPVMHAACVSEQARAPRATSSVRMAFYAMTPLPRPLLAKLRALYPEADVLLGSGQTEATPATVMQWPEHVENASSSWGCQVPSIETAIMGVGSSDLLAPGEVGEIVYRGPNICTGYLRNPDANAVAFEGGWFHSADIGARDAHGVIWFEDRLKDIVKTGGENVSSVAVEEVVLGVAEVAECCVVGVPDPRWGEAVCAYVVPHAGADTAQLEEAVITHAKANLAGFQVPKTVRVVDSLPKTATGKIQKFEVRKLHDHD